MKDADRKLWNTIRDAKIRESIKQKLELAGKDDVDEPSIKAFKRTMEACACSSLRDFLGGQALAMVPSDYSGDSPLKLALDRLRSHANAVLLPIRYEKYRSLMATFMSMGASLSSLQTLYDLLTDIRTRSSKLYFLALVRMPQVSAPHC